MRPVHILLAAIFASASPVASAVKLWKWVDKDGKVTYSESKPRASQAPNPEEKYINPDQNVIKADVPPPSTGIPPVPDRDLDHTKPTDDKRRRGITKGGGGAEEPEPPPPVPHQPPVVPSAPAVPSAPIPQPPPPLPTPGSF